VSVRRFGLGCGGLVAVLLLAGCSSGGTHAAAPSPTTASPTPSRTPSPTPTPKPKPRPKPPAVNPLTGLRGVPKQRVVVVKIDDTANGRPQIGLESADLVYVEQVEAGLTRLAAVFASRHPTVVGPVRSVRKSDPELLGTYGRPALAYSGGAAGPVAVLRRSPVLDAGPQRAGAAYRRLSSRGAPYNLVVDTSRVAAAAVGASAVRDIGLRWSTADPALAAARRVGTVSVTVGRTVLRFRWSGPARAWLELNADGSYRRTASGRPIATPNLVVPFSPEHIDRSDVDVVGNPSVFTSTIGSGRVLVFRDGRVLGGRWRRSRLGGPTAYLDAAGKPIPLHPGGAWVLLAATGAPVDMR
jgi:hypothetical protein